MGAENKFDFYRSYIYDSPDGEDCARKVFNMTKITGFFGAIIGGVEVLGLTAYDTEGIMLGLGRVTYHAAPAAAMGAIFASTVCVAGQLTGQQSAWSHMLGGCLGASVYGVRAQKGIIALGGCVIGAGTAGGVHIAKYHVTPPSYENKEQQFTSNGLGFESYNRVWLKSWGPKDVEPPAPKDY